jgi:hypothetical protein
MYLNICEYIRYATENGAESIVSNRSEKIPYAVFGSCESQPYCTGGVKWTNEYAMPIMANAGGSGEM